MDRKRVLVCNLMVDVFIRAKYEADEYVQNLGMVKDTKEYEAVKKDFIRQLARLRKEYMHKREANKVLLLERNKKQAFIKANEHRASVDRYEEECQ